MKDNERGGTAGEICGFVVLMTIFCIISYYAFQWTEKGRAESVSKQFEAANANPPASLEQLRLFHGLEILQTNDERKVIRVWSQANHGVGQNFYLHLSDRHYAAARSMRFLNVDILAQLDQVSDVENK